MEKKIEQLLELMTDIVNDDMPWKNKKELINTKIKESEYWETAFEEFTSWFER